MIMRAAPVGAFGGMAFTIGADGLGTLLSLAKLMATFYLTCVCFVFIVLGVITRLHGFSIWKFLRYIREELLIVLSTSSSEAALPRTMAKMESLGVGRSTVGRVIPAGYSFNLDGTSIYLTMAAVFVCAYRKSPSRVRGGQRITAGIRCWTTLLREQSQKYEKSTLRLENKTSLVPSGDENPAHLSPGSNSSEDCQVQAARRS
jgi:aerobic C4-dicarboxylate transport protein